MNKAHVKTAHLILTMTTTKGKIYNDGEDSLRNRILQLTCDTAKLSLSLSLIAPPLGEEHSLFEEKKMQ